VTRSQHRAEALDRAEGALSAAGGTRAAIRQALWRLYEDGYEAGRPPRGRGLHTIQTTPEEQAAMRRALAAPFGAGEKPTPPRQVKSPKKPAAPPAYVPGVVTPPAAIPVPAAEARSKTLPPPKAGDPW
jgi:hypothetical protein